MAGLETIEQADAAFPVLVEKKLVKDIEGYRAFCRRDLQEKIVEALAETIGRRVVASELSTHPHDPEPESPVQGFFIMVKAQTKAGGLHFGMSLPEYNPDPSIPLARVLEWRVWAVYNA